MEPLIDLRRTDDVSVARSVYNDICCRVSALDVLIPEEWKTWEGYLRSTLQFQEQPIHEVVFIIEKGPAEMTEPTIITDFLMVMRRAFSVPVYGLKYPAMRFTTSQSIALGIAGKWSYSDWDAAGRVVGYAFKTSADGEFTKLSIYFAGIDEDVLTAIRGLVTVFPYRVRIAQLYTPGDHSPVWVAHNCGEDCYINCFADKSTWDIFKPDVECRASDFCKADAHWRDDWSLAWFKKEPSVDLSSTEFTYF